MGIGRPWDQPEITRALVRPRYIDVNARKLDNFLKSVARDRRPCSDKTISATLIVPHITARQLIDGQRVSDTNITVYIDLNGFETLQVALFKYGMKPRNNMPTDRLRFSIMKHLRR